MNLARCALPFLLFLRAVPASADNLTSLFPPETKVVFGIRVHNLAISSIAQTFAAQAHATAAGWLKAIPLDGIDLLRDIDEVLIASPGSGKNPPTLVVVTGRFDRAHLAEGARRYYRDVPLLGGDKQPDALIAVLDSGTVLLGDAGLVRAAIDQRGGNGKISEELNDRITSLRQRYDIWGLGEGASNFDAPVEQAKMLQSIDRFQFGMQLVSGLELGAEIHARSAEDAKKLNDAASFLAALFQGHDASKTGSKFDLKMEGSSLKLNVYIPESELKKTLQAQSARLSPVPVGKQHAISTPPQNDADAAPQAAPPAPPQTPAPTPLKASGPRPNSSEQDTVIFTLPGKK